MPDGKGYVGANIACPKCGKSRWLTWKDIVALPLVWIEREPQQRNEGPQAVVLDTATCRRQGPSLPEDCGCDYAGVYWRLTLSLPRGANRRKLVISLLISQSKPKEEPDRETVQKQRSLPP
jgi:hypothetical protein